MNEKSKSEIIDAARSKPTLRPAPSDTKAYADWAGKNGVKREQDIQYEKARNRGEVK